MVKKMSEWIFIGIDPGQSGAIAVINEKQDILEVVDWPGDEVKAADIVRRVSTSCLPLNTPIRAALEKVAAMPKQGVSSTFKFATNYGIWKGILAALKIPFIEVRPQAWQKGIVSKKQDGVNKPSVAAAARMFPTAELFGPKGGKKDGRADALLIAEFCRKQFITEKQVERKRR